jgi:hypothetical protein
MALPCAIVTPVRSWACLAELNKNWGITEEGPAQAKGRAIHINAIQPWKVARDGSVHDAMFS